MARSNLNSSVDCDGPCSRDQESERNSKTSPRRTAAGHVARGRRAKIYGTAPRLLSVSLAPLPPRSPRRHATTRAHITAVLQPTPPSPPLPSPPEGAFTRAPPRHPRFTQLNPPVTRQSASSSTPSTPQTECLPTPSANGGSEKTISLPPRYRLHPLPILALLIRRN